MGRHHHVRSTAQLLGLPFSLTARPSLVLTRRYLPTQEPEQRDAITKRFWQYNALCREKLWPVYGAHQHWAKIEVPDTAVELTHVRRRLAARFPLGELCEAKQTLDPKGILGNTLIDALLLPEPPAAA